MNEMLQNNSGKCESEKIDKMVAASNIHTKAEMLTTKKLTQKHGCENQSHTIAGSSDFKNLVGKMSSDDTLPATALATIVNTMTKVFIFTSYPGKTTVHA